MRRLTLILSDLYLPEHAESLESAGAHALPAFEWLLRVSDQPLRIDDWRKWLIAQLRGQAREISLTAHCAYGIVDGMRLDDTWFATPVHLEARFDHVRMTDRGLARLDETERAAACEEFARVFGPAYRLHDGGERTLYLSGLAPVAFLTVDPARLLGSDIGTALAPRGATELRRLSSEIEMWLHGSAFNAARERSGKPRVSTLWLWRGFLPEPHGPVRPEGIEAEYLGGDPLIGALGEGAQKRRRGVPSGFAHLDWSRDHVVAEFAVVTGGAHESLPSLDAQWLGPAKEALLGGRLREIEIVANDRVFRIAAAARWRFWRQQPHWLARLGGAVGN